MIMHRSFAPQHLQAAIAADQHHDVVTFRPRMRAVQLIAMHLIPLNINCAAAHIPSHAISYLNQWYAHTR
jgi:hypothetical protein